jgi:hypothetical protein
MKDQLERQKAELEERKKRMDGSGTPEKSGRKNKGLFK